MTLLYQETELLPKINGYDDLAEQLMPRTGGEMVEPDVPVPGTIFAENDGWLLVSGKPGGFNQTWARHTPDIGNLIIE